MENAVTQQTPAEILRSMMKGAAVIRKTYAEEAIDDHVDTRRACHILYLYSVLKDADMAIEMGISQFDDTTQNALRVLWQKMTPEVTGEENGTE